MLTATRDARGFVVEAMLPPATHAYFDAEWLPREGSTAIEPLVVEDGRWLSRQGTRVEIPARVEPDTAAGLALAAVAAEAAALATAEGSLAGIEVIGDGAVAEHVRALVQGIGPVAASGQAPGTVVDTTGDETTIAAATERLADLGLLILAGEPSGHPVSMNLYPDVHGRGLRLVGVGPSLSNGIAQTLEASGVSLPPALAGTLAQLPAGGRIERRRGWYRLSTGG